MVTAIVTLFNPDSSVKAHIKEFANQTDRVILCDNSKEDHEDKFSDIPGVIYTSKHQNLGLSCAFNRVLKDEKYKWHDDELIVFFDQDSGIKENHVTELIKEYSGLEKKIKIGALGPAFYNKSNDRVEFPRKAKRVSKYSYIVQDLITSSLITRYKILEKVGFWNEELFLDMVDWDLCWRINTAGFQCAMTKRVTLVHEVGEGEKKIGPIHLRVGAPSREYYEIRDCLNLMSKKYAPVTFKIRSIAKLTIVSFLHLLSFDNKRERVHYYFMGIKDFNKGIKGVGSI